MTVAECLPLVALWLTTGTALILMIPYFWVAVFWASERLAAPVRRWCNDPRRPKPPLGWPPWVRPTAVRRLGYAVRYGWWKARAMACAACVRMRIKRSW